MSLEPSTHLLAIDWQPSARKLRQFAVCLASVIMLVMSYASSGTPLLWACLAAGLVMLASWCVPTVIRPFYIAMSLITLPIGMLVGEVALIVVYLGVFLPIGILFRLTRRDTLRRKFDRTAVSYWEESRAEPAPRSYLRRY